MEREGRKLKNGIELDWAALLGKEGNREEEEEPLPVEVVVEKPQSVAMAVEPDEEQSQRNDGCRSMRDKELRETIDRYRSTLQATSGRLRDGGVRLRNLIKLYEDELERRQRLPVQKDDDGCNKPTESQSTTCFNIPDNFKKGAPPSLPPSEPSEFASRFRCKMDRKQELHTLNHCDSVKMRSNGILSRGRKKRGVASRETPFLSTGNLFVDVGKQILSNFDKKDGYFAAFSPHNPKEDLPGSSAKKRISTSRVRSLNRLRYSKGEPVVLDDEDEMGVKEITPQENVTDECSNTRIYFPSRDDPEAVEICCSDMQCLAPETYLSSNIMNFYIRYLQGLMSPIERERCNYHFFNTYFYEKMKEAVLKENSKESSFAKFRRWWKGVNIFEKAYILLPIHEDLHWSLVIICIPDKGYRSGPILLHLDSLRLHSSKSIFNNIKSFLIEEWKFLNEREVQLDLPIEDTIWEKLPRRIQEKVLEVPQQRNDYDCGLFVLYFIKRFIEDAPERLKKDPSNILCKFGKRWFSPKEASSLRQVIRSILKQEFEDTIKN